METPNTLYHGSLYKQTELMPGFKRSGELTVWDGVETNQNLYATTDKQSAILLGIGSGVEKTFGSNRFIELDGNIWIFTDTEISFNKFLEMELYVYTIPFRAQDGWVHNNNPYNNIDTEWKTTKTIHGVKVAQVNIAEAMRGHTVTTTTAPVDVNIELLNSRYGKETKVYKM